METDHVCHGECIVTEKWSVLHMDAGTQSKQVPISFCAFLSLFFSSIVKALCKINILMSNICKKRMAIVDQSANIGTKMKNRDD